MDDTQRSATTGGPVDEQALYEQVQREMSDPATFAQPPLGDRYASVFREMGLRP